MEPDLQQPKQQQKQKSVKVKVGIFFGYNGQEFQGMQYQKQHTNTIQNILHQAIITNGLVLKSNAQELKKIKWSRAARTDKRVHALCNGVSLKLEIYPQFIKEENGNKVIDFGRIVADLNDTLPQDIKVYGIKKVGKHFDMRFDSNSRIYNYIIPAKVFQSYKQFRNGHQISQQQLKAVLQKLNSLVKLYLGTHNFYNFSKGYKQKDPRCERFMISMNAEQVQSTTIQSYLQNHKQTKYQDFIRFTLIGQSFIYHQIRKMIGLLVKIYAEQLDGQEAIKTAFKPEQYDTYLAPGQGLYLNRMTFDIYNKRQQLAQKVQLNEEQQKEVILYRAYLQQKILDHELRQKVFTDWLVNKFQKKEEEIESEEQKSVQNDKN